MIMDLQNRFSNAQSVASGTDTGLISTNVMDLGKPGREIGIGESLKIAALVTTLFASSGSDDPLAVELVTDDNESMSSPTFVQELGRFPAVAPVGTKIVGEIAPIPGVKLERYIALRYLSKGNGPLTAGAVTAGVVKDADAFIAHEDNVTIS